MKRSDPMSEVHRLSARALLWGFAAATFCLLTTPLPAAQTTSESHPNNPFFAMDTATGGGTPDAQATMLKELGYAGMSCGLNHDIPVVLTALDERQLKLFAVYAGVNLGADGPSYPAKLSQVIQQLKGRETIVWLTVTGNAPEAEDQAVKAVREVADLAKAAGLRVALYPHAGFYMARLSDAVHLARKVDRANVGVTFNLCHWLKEGRPDEMLEDIRAAAPHLFVVTINGADRRGTTWEQLIQPLGQGDFDVAALLKALREAGFRGPVGFQGYGIGGNARENLRRTITAWKTLAR
jgi:sugar phosphate isomerase/epimerase